MPTRFVTSPMSNSAELVHRIFGLLLRSGVEQGGSYGYHGCGRVIPSQPSALWLEDNEVEVCSNDPGLLSSFSFFLQSFSRTETNIQLFFLYYILQNAVLVVGLQVILSTFVFLEQKGHSPFHYRRMKQQILHRYYSSSLCSETLPSKARRGKTACKCGNRQKKKERRCLAILRNCWVQSPGGYQQQVLEAVLLVPAAAAAEELVNHACRLTSQSRGR